MPNNRRCADAEKARSATCAAPRSGRPPEIVAAHRCVRAAKTGKRVCSGLRRPPKQFPNLQPERRNRYPAERQHREKISCGNLQNARAVESTLIDTAIGAAFPAASTVTG
jgi:hypothetical protein